LLGELEELGLSPSAVFVNRVLSPRAAEKCSRCLHEFQWQAAILGGLKQRFRGMKIFAIREFDYEIAGKQRLRDLTSNLWRLN